MSATRNKRLYPLSPEEASWIGTSRYWLDRKACTWFGACGIQHMDPSKWTPEDRILREIPRYVLDHAPYVHLYSGEEFWPSDIAEHLIHTTPRVNYTPIDEQWQHPNLSNLWKLNYWGRSVYLQSDDNVEERPGWLGSKENIPARPKRKPEDLDDGEWFQGKMYPWQSNLKEALKGGDKFLKMGFGDLKFKGGDRKNPPGVYPPGQWEHPFPEPGPPRRDGYKSELRKRQNKSEFREQWKPSHRLGGRSDAPAVLIVVDKGHGVVDAFWFFFYSYNLGNTVFNVRFGNHVGDWEHTMVRFYNGVPKLVFFSEHAGGEAYTYDAVERFGKRPVAYSATGTHAMYATPGVHAYVLPFGLLHDITDRGPLWDPTLNLHAYTYDYRNDTLRTSTLTPKSPRGWFYFMGHWGDKFYPLSDSRQYRFAGQYHYVNGPLGPRFKNLGRRKVCQWNGECSIRGYIGEAGIIRRGSPVGKDLDDNDAKIDF
ncbi:hypothetical protein NA57DRAFT_64752 [Rhizodiscina lignyota]|uniref:Vacuolar protein sorting-associated protein 62 n=1 Tax=Rhizodiscina lignyota TaxID=1504668 RepID=A0A9P4M8Z0_9PEZI|nr:hypothetical protein NA57DRAFT_64752 [Rhizodiscina lignyota]